MTFRESFDFVGSQVLNRLGELMLAPYHNEDMLWIVVPMMVATLLMTLYFGKHKNEELGWNTAYGNSMIFLFVALDIFRYLYKSTSPPSFYNFISTPLYMGVSIVLFLIGLLLLVINYWHILPEKIDFILCSGPPVNVTTYTILSIVYAGVTPDRYTALASFVFLIILVAVLRLLQLVQRIVTHNLDDVQVLRAPKMFSRPGKKEENSEEE